GGSQVARAAEAEELVSGCLFCRIVAGEIPSKRAYEDAEVVAFHDIAPQAPVHVLVIPRGHVATIADLALEGPAPSMASVMSGARRAADALGLNALDGY